MQQGGRHSYRYWQGLADDQARSVMVRALEALPAQWEGRVRAVHGATWEAKGREAATEWVKGLQESVRGLLLPLGADDGDILAEADRQAVECMRGAGEFSADLESFHERAGEYCRRRGIEPPASRLRGEGGELNDAARRAELARMTCPQWWRRQLRRLHGRTVERHAIGLGYVHAGAERYSSNMAGQRRASQKRRNRMMLERTEAINQDGEVFTLAQLADVSTANPTIRRAELMTRIRGFEEVARERGDVADCWTLTCPSRFHAMTTRGGKAVPNPRHDGSTPREAQQHLVTCWAQLRAYLDRRGIKVYGFRVAEPHKDGCPHWHALLFMPPEHRQAAREAARRYFLLKHDPHEPGADEKRVEVKAVHMDATRSAAGYIAKYIAKNIDGFKVENDLFGDEAVTVAARVDAWAATWGVRQFQQIGGAPVGVWREVRKLRQADAERGEAMEAARAAADEGEWADYLRAQGGPLVRRDDLRLVTIKTREGEGWNGPEGCPEPAALGRYGEPAKGVVFGVRDVAADRAAVTRFNSWTVQQGAKVAVMPHDAEAVRARTEAAYLEVIKGRAYVESGCSDWGFLSGGGAGGAGWPFVPGGAGASSGAGRLGGRQVSGLGVEGFEGLARPQAAQPWTCVNNCTGGG